jgi:hypothetical protein
MVQLIQVVEAEVLDTQQMEEHKMVELVDLV